MRKLWAKQNGAVVQCENSHLCEISHWCENSHCAKFRTAANDLVMLVIFTCLVLRYRILYRNITSPSAQ